jgi:hypothetical protein
MEVTGHITCDGCGVAMTDGKRWLLAVTNPPTGENPGGEGIAFGPIDASFDPSLPHEHFCGNGCAVKRFSLYLESLSAAERVI